MSDINLLPEDLRKKQEKTLRNRGDFNLDEIEFTEGEKLKKDIDSKPDVFIGNKMKKWFRPKIDNKLKIKKKYNKIDKTNNTSFIPKTDNKPKEVKKEIEIKTEVKKDFNDLKEINSNIYRKSPEVSKEINNKPEKKNILNSSIKSKTNNQKAKKAKKIRTNFKNLIRKFRKKKVEKNKEKKNIDVNLLPFGSNVPTTKRILSILIIAFILSSSLIFIIYFGYHIYKEQIVKNHNNLENELNLYMEETKKFDDLIYEITVWQEKVREIETLLSEHIYWTKFFEKLEENTLPNVKFIGFAGMIDTNITLQAIAPDYQTVSKQWIRLQNADDFVKEVVIDGATMSPSENNINISFSLTLDFVDDIFYK